MTHRLSLSFALVIVAAVLAACGQESATLVLVNVEGKDGVVSRPGASNPTRTIASLEATFIQGGEPVSQILSPKGSGTIELPTSFVLRADGREGAFELDLSASDDHPQTLGKGTVTGTLSPDLLYELTAVLFPDDFGVNANHQGKQFFSTEAGFGREVAAAADGSFVVVWEDDCGELVRCDIYYRLFDSTGTPRLNGGSGGTDEGTANEGNDAYDMPSVAAHENGGFLIAWQRATSNGYKIFSRTFTADGRPDPSSNGGSEVELSGSEVKYCDPPGASCPSSVIPSVPQVIALRDGGYLVVWQQTAEAVSWELKARYLGPDGMPMAAYNGSTEPFLVHSFGSKPSTCDNGKCDSGETCMNCPNDCVTCGPWPVAAASTDQGFLIAWNEDGLVRGRPFGARAIPLASPLDLDAAKTKKVNEVAASPIRGGYAVAWSDTLSSGPDTDGTCIRLRRVDPLGAPFQAGEEEFTVNTSSTGDQRTPALAMRGDGSLLVTWAADSTDPDPDGGIRGRLVLHNLLPVGLDYPVNTTTDGTQKAPALATHLPESYVSVFVDDSGTYPDNSETGIRARLLYPEYGPRDGLIGSLCDNDSGCNAGLGCVDTEAGPRCVALCATPGASCPEGGVCTSLPSGGQACLFGYQKPPG